LSSKSVKVLLAIFLKYQSRSTFVILAAQTINNKINITSQEANNTSFSQSISFFSNTVSPASVLTKETAHTIPDKIKNTTKGPPVTNPIRLKRAEFLFFPVLNFVFISISNIMAAAKDAPAKNKEIINASLYSEKVINIMC